MTSRALSDGRDLSLSWSRVGRRYAPRTDRLDIRLNSRGLWVAVDLLVNGTKLQSMITYFEKRSGYRPAGGYDSISVDGMQPAADRLRGAPESWADEGETLLLVCGTCREEGCQPMFAQIRIGENLVEWTKFRGTFHEERDYAGLHFAFDRRLYDLAVAQAFDPV